METKLETLGDALPKQIERNEKLVEIYKELGPIGTFARLAIGNDIRRAKEAIKNQDVVLMLQMYSILERNK